MAHQHFSNLSAVVRKYSNCKKPLLLSHPFQQEPNKDQRKQHLFPVTVMTFKQFQIDN